MRMLTLMIQIKSIAAPLCPVAVGIAIAGLLWSIWLATQDGMARLKRLHQIPCSGCAYFTGDYRLKCTVHPCKALTEEALECLDYEPSKKLARCACAKPCSTIKAGRILTVSSNE